MSLLGETIASIEPLDEGAGQEAARRLDSLTKPLGSLGYLEELVRRYAAVAPRPFGKDRQSRDAGVRGRPRDRG